MKPITFTKITSSNGPITKTISLDENGLIKKDSAAKLHLGRFETVSIPNLEHFANELEVATPFDAYCYGVTGMQSGALVSEDNLTKSSGAIARTRNFFGWQRGSGILMLDNDNGQIFDDTLAEFLAETVTFIEGVDMLVRPSSSSNIFNSDTGECIRGMVNQRVYIGVSDASYIPAIGKLIEAKLWLSGHGYYDISSAGTLLKRCTADTSVWQPERLDFVGGALCVPPIEQRQMTCRLIEGHHSTIDVRYLPKISAQDQREILKLEQSAKSSVEGERQHIRSAWEESRVSDLVRRGVNQDIARYSVQQAADMQSLGGDFLIKLQNGLEITIAELLSKPEQYNGHRCHDPLEPEYHNDSRVAYISLNNGGRPYIYSHAHGGCRYDIHKPPRTIQILSGESARNTDEISIHLSEQGEVYERGQALLSVQPNGQTKLLNTAGVKYLAGSVCRLVRHDGNQSKGLKATDLTDTIAQLILSRGGCGVFKKLASVITAPTMTHEGRIVSASGYDEKTGLLLQADNEFPQPQINRRPNQLELKEAFNQLYEPVRDFPFDGDVSRSCLIAAMITAVVRPCLPTAPAFGFDAPTQGSGKTKLAQCVAALGSGRVEPLFPPPTEDEETRKKISTALTKGRSVVIFDNMETQLKSPVLAAFLTSRIWSDRLLGGNTEIEAENRMLVLVTGNNLSPVGDIVRRLLTVRIDPQLEASEVWKREFTIDPLDYIVRNRPRLVAAVLTILSGYYSAGRPKVAKGSLASFEQWDDMVRQPTTWLSQQGIDGLCDPTIRLSEAAATDPDALRLSSLASLWHNKYESAPQQLSGVINCIELVEALKEVATDRQGKVNVKMLASYLRQRVGKIVDGFKFERTNGRSHTSLWKVVSL